MTDLYWSELAWLGGATAEAGVLIEVDGGQIIRLQAGVASPAGATRLRGLTMPGLVNAHSHAFHRALRGRTHGGEGSFWTWREQMYRVAERLDPDSYHGLARAVFGEMLLAGITCVGEFHYLHHGPGGVPYDDPNAMGAALLAAAADVGIRITLLDTCYLHGGVGADGAPLALNPVQQRFSDGDADSFAERAAAVVVPPGAAARTGAAVHSVRAVDPASIGEVARWAGAAGLPLHAHVSEQPAENEQCIAAHHLTPSALLAEHGALGPDFTAVHATHLSGVDIGLLGNSGCTCCLCPTTERDLADGIGPARLLRAAGAGLALGTDSHAVIDLFEEARGVELDERLATLGRGHHPPEVLLAAATAGGARSLGWPTGGVLAAGAPADFITLRLDTVRTAGAGRDAAVATAVFAATSGDVRDVVVAGRQVVEDGVHVSLDVPATLAAAVTALW